MQYTVLVHERIPATGGQTFKPRHDLMFSVDAEVPSKALKMATKTFEERMQGSLTCLGCNVLVETPARTLVIVAESPANRPSRPTGPAKRARKHPGL